MITLITGQPGNGKSALAVQLMRTEYKDRPVFSMGIPELKLTHIPVPPVKEWTELRPLEEDPSISFPHFTFPPNAVIFIDEAQTIYRPRPSGSRVPDHVQAQEKHRHGGVDFVLLTQHPRFLDQNIRSLTGRHFHVHDTPLGKKLLEWAECRDPSSKADRGDAVTIDYKVPKEVYSLYRSTVLVTKTKRRLPFTLYVVIACLILFLAIGGFLFMRAKQRFFDPASPAPQSSAAAPGASSGTAPSSASSSSASAHPVSSLDYVASWQPRVEGLPHTAPVYDQITQPAEAPIPSLCVDSKKTGCRCWTQQNTRYATTEDICRQIVRDGFYIPWKRPEYDAAPVERQRLPETKPQSLLAAAGSGQASDHD